MANPTEIDKKETELDAETTPKSVRLNGFRPYTLLHRVTNQSGATDEALIFILIGVGDAAVDYTSGEDKFILKKNVVRIIGPGVDRISFISLSGNPCFSVSPGAETEKF